jgi:serine/threonine protein kinase
LRNKNTVMEPAGNKKDKKKVKPIPNLEIEVPPPKYSPGATLGDYTIQQFIQGGAYGSVYSVFKQPNSDHIYALKAIERQNIWPDELKRLKIEKEIMAKINHENIVQLHEFIDDPKYTDYFMILGNHNHFEPNKFRFLRGR